MKIALLLICVLSLNAQEEPSVLTQFTFFNQLPTELRAKIVMHLCDDIPFNSFMSAYWGVLPRVIPILKTCKKYYLNDKQFTKELLMRVSAFSRSNIFFVGVNVPTPACKLFLSEYIQSEGCPKKELYELGFMTLNLKHCRMLDDIHTGSFKFKESL